MLTLRREGAVAWLYFALPDGWTLSPIGRALVRDLLLAASLDPAPGHTTLMLAEADGFALLGAVGAEDVLARLRVALDQHATPARPGCPRKRGAP